MSLAATLLTLALADCDDIVAARSGDLFLACHSPSDKFTVPVNGHKAVNDEMDGYVIRLKKDSHEIVYVTRMGGGAYDSASRVAIDEEGNAWVAGFTKSADFPVAADAWQRTYGGDGDAFLMKLSPSGRVLFSTFIGGPKSDFGNAIVMVGNQAVIAGTSDGDGFVQSGPSRQVTFGATGEEKLTGLAQHKGKLYATGYTKSNDWKTLRGLSDAFVVRLNAQTLAIESAEYFGGSGDDSAWGIAIDKRGRIFIAGQTSSTDLPGASRGFQRRYRGNIDAFVAQIGGPATYFGGSQKDEAGYDGQNIAIDTDGSVWIAGMTYSTDLPAEGSYGGGDGDGFIAKFTPALNKVHFASYAGSPAREIGEGIAIVPGGALMTMVRLSDKEGVSVGPFFAQSVISVWRPARPLTPNPRSEIRIDTGEADAALAFLAEHEDVSRIWGTEGYIRLKKREAEMGRSFSENEFEQFLDSDALRRRKEALRSTLTRWKQADIKAITERVRSYLPPNARLRATVYIVIKPRSNSFVYELATNPAVFAYLDPEITKEEFENTIAHELHHVGLASLEDAAHQVGSSSANVRQAVKWIGAFGEGLAMLAAAGGPDIHPHLNSSTQDRARWDASLRNLRQDMHSVEAFLLDTMAGKLDEKQQNERGMSFFGVQGPWYTVGWTMAVTVEKVKGRPALIDCMTDMRTLLRYYNDAASQLQPKWSEKFLKALASP
ncbi:MAG: DUF5700 domain-containing putative Zn-dependent protease [Planctomycetia bacterium]|nr:DUF5700 domain-containing putative Zn-dependent protease [Planctomycetia bacterium]